MPIRENEKKVFFMFSDLFFPFLFILIRLINPRIRVGQFSYSHRYSKLNKVKLKPGTHLFIATDKT